MIETFIQILRISTVLLLLGPDLLNCQHSNQHRKVPKRIEAQQDPESGEAAGPGSWGPWGPWGACSRTCGGGVQEQTRPCLSAYSPAVTYPSKAAHPPRSSGHVVSALRPSVPLHRNTGQPPYSNGTGSHPGGHRKLRGQQRDPRVGRRRGGDSRRITPGMYGYGKMPFVMPLQTDTGQEPGTTPPRRQRRAPPSGALYPGQHGGHQQTYRQHGPNYGYGGGHHWPQTSQPRTHPARTSLYQPSPAHNPQQPPHSDSQPPQTGPHSPLPTSSCTGSQKQYKMCNVNSCPPTSRSVREMQCSSYNNQPFMGRLYEWEPFNEGRGDQSCELNCLAIGFRFYVRQAEKVIDGTPCGENETSICVEGTCQTLGCDDYLGSGNVLDKCGVCGGDNSTCKVVSGVFKHPLTKVGYHKIVEIPEGATKINVTEMIKSQNNLALRSRSGRSIINGNWAIDRPGMYEGAGTMFTYRRPNEISNTAGESFLAEGPTNEILDVFMIYRQPNPGVHYEYVVPVENRANPQFPPDTRPGGNTVNGRGGYIHPSHPNQEGYVHGRGYPPQIPDNQVPVPQPPRRQREHSWKLMGTTDCSATCGRGTRYTVFRCVHRVTHEQVTDSLCDSATRPSPQGEPCNMHPCPAYWDIGEWSECSKTCGLGMQHRQVLCRQVYANRTLNVQTSRCQHLERPETTSTCQLKICSEWQIRTDWTTCSVPCGVGQKSREVRCVSNVGDTVLDQECNMRLRPNDVENCDMGPCAKSWFFTEWGNQCSAECGLGVRTRSVLCLTNHISSLPLEGCGSERPQENQVCNNGPCDTRIEWFTGRWSQCSAECGTGTQQREVVCLMKSDEGFAVLPPYECSSLDRPLNQQTCQLKPCGAKWYHTDWSSCSKTCEGGFRVREVRCLSDDMLTSEACAAQARPGEREACNREPCLPQIDENCRDKYFNCNVVVQARLCVYNYYKAACCASCSRVSQRQAGFRGRR
ncbi:thrombospondin type-1 domain-containing protein 4-like isoform X1 [Anguilla rostrata]|uniref:thrombospondin type-1 domain-containing protein 4-like isoform X1 n=1 Tax=Anguilla rostrata TaxID=7938 RepID=UPI0030CAF6E5